MPLSYKVVPIDVGLQVFRTLYRPLSSLIERQVRSLLIENYTR
jgi:hypothetical protein